MKKSHVLTLAFTALVPVFAFADYDPALEAQEAAQRQAAQAAAAKQKAQMDAIKHDAQTKMEREFVGAEANGKSDGEVSKLYAAKMQKMRTDSIRANADGQKLANDMQKKAAETHDQRSAAMKAMTGKTSDELMGMSDEELEAFSKQMEAQYGGK